MMKRMLIALLASLFVSPLYALNEENRTIEFPQGVTCHFDNQMTNPLRYGQEIMDTYICEGEDMGVLSVVYYENLREDVSKRLERSFNESIEGYQVGDWVVAGDALSLVVLNKPKHMVRAFRFDEDKRIEYVSLVKTWKGKATFYHDMEKLEVPATPVTAE